MGILDLEYFLVESFWELGFQDQSFLVCWTKPQLIVVDISFRDLIGFYQHQLVSRSGADLWIEVGITHISNLGVIFGCNFGG